MAFLEACVARTIPQRRGLITSIVSSGVIPKGDVWWRSSLALSHSHATVLENLVQASLLETLEPNVYT